MKMDTIRKYKMIPLLVVFVALPFLAAPYDPGCGVCFVNLAPYDITVKPYGQGSLVVVWIENQGDMSSPGFWVDVFVNHSEPPNLGDLSDHYVWSHGARKNGVRAVAVYLELAPKELEWIDVIVDSTGLVSESVESDNMAAFDR